MQYTTANELADILRRADGSRTIVLDVRDDDFHDLGHVRVVSVLTARGTKRSLSLPLLP